MNDLPVDAVKPKKRRKSMYIKANRGSHNHATELERQNMLQVYMLTGSFRETARVTKFAEPTVTRVVKEMIAQDNKDLQNAQRVGAQRLAGRVHEKASKILDSIKDEDLVSGRIPITDASGKITGYRELARP